MELIAGDDSGLGTLSAPGRHVISEIAPAGSSVLAAGDLDGDGMAEVLRALRGVQGSTAVRGAPPRPMLALGTFDIDQTIPGDQPASPLTQIITVRLDNRSVVPYAIVPQAPDLAWLDLSRAVRGAPSAIGVSGDASNLRVAAGNIDTALLKRGDELAIGFVGGTELHVRRPDFGALLTIALPAPLAATPVFGDVDGDGTVDLAAPVAGGGVAVSAGTGADLATTAQLDLRFAAPPPPPCGFGTSTLIGGAPRLIADLNRDGTTDYVTADGIIVQLGNGSYCRAFASDLSSNAASAVALDANGDGLLDVALASGSDTSVLLAIDQGGSSFEVRSIPTAGIPIGLRAGSFDWDSFDDLLVVNAPIDGMTPLEIAKGTNLAATQLVLAAPRPPGLVALSAGPYGSRDGIFDLVMLGIEPGRDAPYLASVDMIGDGSKFVSELVEPSAGRAAQLLVGAVAGTPGRDDAIVVLEDRASGETFAWVLPDQRSYLTDRAAYVTPDITQPSTAPTTLADVDGDGRDELVVADEQGLAAYKLVPASGQPFRISAPPATALATVRRAGGDCIVLAGAMGARLECVPGGTPTSVILTTAPAFGAVALDVDGDGALEAVVVHDVSLAVYELEPASLRDTFVLSTTHASPARVCSGDFDGDGVGDLAMTTDATVELWWGVAHDRGGP